MTSPPQPKRHRAAIIAALVTGPVLALGGVGVAVTIALRSSAEQREQEDSQKTLDDAKEAARLAGCDFARVLSTYSYTDPDAYRKGVEDGAIGEAKALILENFPQLAEMLETAKVTSRAGEVQCFLKSGDLTRAEVAVIANHTVQNSIDVAPRTHQLSMTLTFENVDGTWLCSKTHLHAASK